MKDHEYTKYKDYSRLDHAEWAKRRKKVKNSKWNNHSLNKPKKSNHIDLKEHETHDWEPLKGPFGPHAGKIVCNTCKGKWVAWLAKGTI